jgi:hypothetical protein
VQGKGEGGGGSVQASVCGGSVHVERWCMIMVVEHSTCAVEQRNSGATTSVSNTGIVPDQVK